ncbi:dTDP-4-dehydrorhamnose 3,5-epimerase [Massilia sp. CCM 8734]|uniref:dTDP-4-dehydrorhamnose 3,5-epimerase n=1 Tax=Massilia sp. CCM 8734 TaxID=2609283 RepID=UPI00142141E2|nr:dTDP-4-dehydrorhamnose 3,5-epimerase [Massilia sp. CCM 8734]NHZ99225.1 dTDP-4-dehydrorhamnose 3,5-epimerase [Massilia sp. CCM 8734]
MRLTPTPLAGAFLIDIDPVEDERGLFARTVCADEFARDGLVSHFVQQSVSWNPRAGTLRGLHFQIAPDQEIKLVRVTRGAVFDVIVDVRPGSATYGKAFHAELSAENRRQLYLPAGMAHGFQSLQAGTEVLYQMSAPFRPASARGLRWDDAALNIPWPPCATRTIADNDRAWPTLAGLTS